MAFPPTPSSFRGLAAPARLALFAIVLGLSPVARAEEERHVVRVLEVALAHDAAAAMVAAVGVRGGEALDARDPRAAGGQVHARGGAHGAGAEDDGGTCAGHHVPIVGGKCAGGHFRREIDPARRR